MHEANPRLDSVATPHQEHLSPAHARYLTKLTIISTLGGLLFGYDTGVISGAPLLSARCCAAWSASCAFTVSLSSLIG